MEPQPQLVIPTPPVATPELIIPNEAGQLVTDPVSDVVPTVDPAVESLITEVSQQQLMAYVRQLEGFGTRNAFSDTQSETFGIGAARRWIFNEFVRVGNGRLTVEFQDFPLSYNGYTAEQSNVVATLPGKGNGNGVLIIMGHYDNRPPDVTDGASRATGANDNASGIALLLETARVMSSRDWNQTIIFLATSAEEQGSFGARFYAENAFMEGKNIISALNYDAVGGRAGIPQHARLFAVDFLTSAHGALGRYYEYVGGLYLPTFPVVIYDALDREGRWGDHREFVRAGFPAIRLIESVEDPDLVNSNRDTWDLIDYTYLQRMAQLNVSVAANLAGGPHQPAPPIIAAMAEPGAYLLTWPVTPDASGYAISFRPVDSVYYPTFRFVKASNAGNVALTGLDPSVTYAVSIAALNERGLVSGFSTEQFIGPNAALINPSSVTVQQ
ncbi:M20/M25/M40 family metallo-hydrolase [Candidatus Promineifilum breve]|uniref:M20/M25/M40 family metallo-hydrolase n=1 Tax=Candidatus Promineifilum breve TaxID=1806508 RepID=UPI000BA21652|nr:M20/M25/M40 family metallo-hydrolase [Candidatus Promineifilum breve]